MEADGDLVDGRVLDSGVRDVDGGVVDADNVDVGDINGDVDVDIDIVYSYEVD